MQEELVSAGAAPSVVGREPELAAVRALLQAAALAGGVLLSASTPSAQGMLRRKAPGWVEGKMTGAMAVVETLLQEGCECVYGIPGAQENELWDAMKTKGLPSISLPMKIRKKVNDY